MEAARELVVSSELRLLAEPRAALRAVPDEPAVQVLDHPDRREPAHRHHADAQPALAANGAPDHCAAHRLG
eukprot:1676685-Lingulodinium_polyedra.AAC.1